MNGLLDTLAYRVGPTETPFLSNGRYGVQTDANGLLHMRARYYNPYLARFLNADPSGFGGGLNFYAYADGNPVSLIDPFGLGAVGASTGRSWVQSQSWYQDLQNMQAGARQYGGTPSGGQIFNTFLDFVPGGMVAKSFYTLSTGRELGTGAWPQRSDAAIGAAITKG